MDAVHACSVERFAWVKYELVAASKSSNLTLAEPVKLFKAVMSVEPPAKADRSNV